MSDVGGTGSCELCGGLFTGFYEHLECAVVVQIAHFDRDAAAHIGALPIFKDFEPRDSFRPRSLVLVERLEEFLKVLDALEAAATCFLRRCDRLLVRYDRMITGGVLLLLGHL